MNISNLQHLQIWIIAFDGAHLLVFIDGRHCDRAVFSELIFEKSLKDGSLLFPEHKFFHGICISC